MELTSAQRFLLDNTLASVPKSRTRNINQLLRQREALMQGLDTLGLVGMPEMDALSQGVAECMRLPARMSEVHRRLEQTERAL